MEEKIWRDYLTTSSLGFEDYLKDIIMPHAKKINFSTTCHHEIDSIEFNTEQDALLFVLKYS